MALVLWLTCTFATGLHAQSIKGGDLEKLCSARAESGDRLACTLVVKAYMDGFLEGVAKGVFGTYQYDPQVLAIVKDIKVSEMSPRIAKVIDAATCLQRATVEDITRTFMIYVQQHPESREEHYRHPMTRAVISKYCGKQPNK